MRQSGRTTRMLQAALKKCQEGHTVYIVAASIDEADRLRREFLRLGGERFYHLTRIWTVLRMRTRVIYPERPIFWDHYAVECELARIDAEFNRLTRWRDEVEKQGNY